MKYLPLLTVILAGCICNPDRPKPHAPTGRYWDTYYLVDADPSTVDLDVHEEFVNDHYWAFVQYEGMIWEPTRSDPGLYQPDGYGNGGDTAIFTGMALGAWCFKYGVQDTTLELDRVMETLRGVWILTHATGVPGAICRAAFPQSQAARWDYPRKWQHRIDKGFVGTGPALSDPVRGRELEPHKYYTRATKDQLTGLLFGLAVTWKTLDPSSVHINDRKTAQKARRIVAEITESLYQHLRKYDWKIKDAFGRNDTNADKVSGLQKTQLLALRRLTVSISKPTEVARALRRYEKEFVVHGPGDYFGFFNNNTQYFAWNLRYLRAFTIWLLEDDPDRKEKAREFVDKFLWPYTRGHQNAWYLAVRNAMNPGDHRRIPALIRALKSHALRPTRQWSSPFHGREIKPSTAIIFNCEDEYVLPPHWRKPAGYFTWVKEPWDVGPNPLPDTRGLQDQTGLGLLLPLWTARYFKLF